MGYMKGGVIHRIGYNEVYGSNVVYSFILLKTEYTKTSNRQRPTTEIWANFMVEISENRKNKTYPRPS